MKRVLIALSLLTLAAAPSWAGGGGFGLFGSGWGPDAADGVFGGGAKIEASVGHGLDFVFKGSFYDRLKSTLPDGTEFEFGSTIVELGLDYNFGRGKSINPYLGAGMSYYLFDVVEKSIGSIGNETGWYVEGGLEIPVGERWAFFAEAMWREADMTLKGDDLGFGQVKEILDIGGPAGNLGFMLTW